MGICLCIKAEHCLVCVIEGNHAVTDNSVVNVAVNVDQSTFTGEGSPLLPNKPHHLPHLFPLFSHSVSSTRCASLALLDAVYGADVVVC